MLNSNNSTSNASSSSGNGNGGSKKQANSSGVSTTTCVVTCATTTTVSTVCTSATEREAVITNSGDIPANSGQKACDSLTDNTTKHKYVITVFTRLTACVLHPNFIHLCRLANDINGLLRC